MNWQTPKLSGTKETLPAKVTASALPQNVKEFILSEVASLPAETSIVTVTGYSADHSHPMHATATTRNIQITISSAVL